jgi:EmrB/QacA subfamily drug resistance transporter
MRCMHDASESSAAADEAAFRKSWLVLGLTGICMTVVAYNTTALLTVLPIIRAEFDLRPNTLQWVMTIYLISAAAMIPVMGRLGDLFGKLQIFTVGIVSFAVGSLTVALADGGGMLIAGRLAQGVGAGTLLATSLAIVSAAVAPRQRAFVVGLWGGMVALGMSIGPIVGGLCGEYLNWRWIFYSDLALLAISLLLLLRAVSTGYQIVTARTDDVLDLPGAVLLILTLGLLSFGISGGAARGWVDPVTVSSVIIGVCAAIIFCWRERHAQYPLWQLDYFRHPRIVAGTISIFITAAVMMGVFYFFNLFVQAPDTFGLSPVAAGIWILPLTATMFMGSIVLPRILAAYSFRWPITLGLSCLAIGCYLLSGMTNTSVYAELWWKLTIIGIGLGLTLPLIPRIVMRVMAEEHVGQGSSMVNTFLNLGATSGLVLCGLAHAYTVRQQLSEVIAALPLGSNQRETLVDDLANGAASEIQNALAGLEPATSDVLKLALRNLQDDAFDAAMLTVAFVALLGAIAVCYLMRGDVPAENSASELLVQHKSK